MVLYKCEVQADVPWFIKLKFSKVFYKYCCFCWNVGVGIALTLRQLGNTDVPHLSGALRSCPHVPVSRSLPLVLISWTTSVITSDLRIIWLLWIEISLLTCTCCYLAVSSWGLEGRGHSRTEFTCTTQALLQINTVFSAYLLCSFGLALLQLCSVCFLAVTSAGLGVVLLYYRAQILLVEPIWSIQHCNDATTL